MSDILFMVQFFFAIVIGLYFLNLLKNQQGNKVAIDRESKKEMEKLQKLRRVSLTQPLSEKTRPTTFDEIEGQDDGIRALRAALCSPNPQHVIIYGPPGVGKTAAARLILEEAKKSSISPFKEGASFIEVDATTVRFDERGIADPLMGSVHDPIYQGAGAMGVAGIPQPKPGAVTKAHGGILFIDEIGELHPIQMNKLLKVLEDRKVYFESAYYNSEDNGIPEHIHEIFKNGLPADFRLVGATTRLAEDIPPALRSRCIEIYFKPLKPEHIKRIAANAARKSGLDIEDRAVELIGRFSANGREAVNMVQTAGGVCITEGRKKITAVDIEWVINCSHYSPRIDNHPKDRPQVGYANGLAVYSPSSGALMEIEASAIPVEKGKGSIIVTGIVDEEETGAGARKLKRRSTAKSSVDNVITVIRKYLGVDPRDYDIHLNFPGGIPIDGPSAGITIATAIYSAIVEKPIDNMIAMTGEVSIRGEVKPVGGVPVKIEAAYQAGVKCVIIPRENWQDSFRDYNFEIITVERIEHVIDRAIVKGGELNGPAPPRGIEYLSASPLK
ncbi:MAG: ATP-dependent protease La LonB Type I [Firmicutes bacterium]|nr:ATP-dependent protease La LonB Type I [Bacillota bacterium]